jgi:ketosteroid isomerase-like protein
MATDPNSARLGSSRVELAQQFLARTGQSDVQLALDMLSPSAVYQVVGPPSISGTFTTPEAIKNHLVMLAERTTGRVEMTKWDDWLIGEHHVAGVAQVQVQGRAEIYRGRQLFLMAFTATNLIERITVFFDDEAAATRFFGA